MCSVAPQHGSHGTGFMPRLSQPTMPHFGFVCGQPAVLHTIVHPVSMQSCVHHGVHAGVPLQEVFHAGLLYHDGMNVPWGHAAPAWQSSHERSGHGLPINEFAAAARASLEWTQASSAGLDAERGGFSSHGFDDFDERFTIDPARMCSDGRTTLIIKNLSYKTTQERLIALLSKAFAGRFDFVCVPVDFRTGGTFGYGFVNLRRAADALPFYQRFHGFRPPGSRSAKSWLVAYARIQGMAALRAHTIRSSDQRIAPAFLNVPPVANDGPADASAAPSPGTAVQIESKGSDGASGTIEREPRRVRRAKARALKEQEAAEKAADAEQQQHEV